MPGTGKRVKDTMMRETKCVSFPGLFVAAQADVRFFIGASTIAQPNSLDWMYNDRSVFFSTCYGTADCSILNLYHNRSCKADFITHGMFATEINFQNPVDSPQFPGNSPESSHGRGGRPGS